MFIWHSTGVKKLRVPHLGKLFPYFYGPHKDPPQDLTLSQINPVRVLRPSFCKIHFNNILPYACVFKIRITFLQAYRTKFLWISFLCHISCNFQPNCLRVSLSVHLVFHGRIMMQSGNWVNSRNVSIKFNFIASLGAGDNVVGIATGYGLHGRGVGVRVPVGSRIITSPSRPDRLWGPPSLLFNGYRG
jgi:hypothetical protein